MVSSKLCIDARMVQATGIGTYLQGLLSGLRATPPSNLALNVLGTPSALTRGPWSERKVSSSIYSLTEQIEIPWAMRKEHATLLHSPHYNLPWLVAERTVVTVHDLIHLKFPHYWPSFAARSYAHFFFHHVVPKARAIITVSENTKKDLMEILSIPESRITVTYPAVTHERFSKLEEKDLAQFFGLKLPSPYLLYVGNLKEFKNVERLLEAYSRSRGSRSEWPALVMVGRSSIPGFEKRLADTPGVRWINNAPWNLLPSFYKNALGFVFPSLYEGFGLPPLEAMASGIPVITSNRGSLPEVVGDAALVVDPESVEEISAAMTRFVLEPTLRQDLAAKGLKQAARFSWDRMAAQTVKVYERCLS